MLYFQHFYRKIPFLIYGNMCVFSYKSGTKEGQKNKIVGRICYIKQGENFSPIS